MFQAHNPAQHTFNWYCDLIGADQSNVVAAATRLRDIVKKIRTGYRSPFGTKFSYGQQSFQNGYLVAYFPYYIEPIYHVLKSADLPDELFNQDNLQVSFFGGGPCPEALGLAAYLREKVPNLKSVDISIFDREMSWNTIQQGLLPQMLPDYAADKTRYSIHNRSCNVAKCDAMKCSNSLAIAASEIIIAQNFLAEVSNDCDAAINTFEGIVRRSNCRYLIFVENNYSENRGTLDIINRCLHSKGLSTGLAEIDYNEICPNFTLPDVLYGNLFTGESGLIAKKYVKYHSMVIEIKRDPKS